MTPGVLFLDPQPVTTSLSALALPSSSGVLVLTISPLHSTSTARFCLSCYYDKLSHSYGSSTPDSQSTISSRMSNIFCKADRNMRSGLRLVIVPIRKTSVIRVDLHLPGLCLLLPMTSQEVLLLS